MMVARTKEGRANSPDMSPADGTVAARSDQGFRHIRFKGS
jgi:hypothetical protein